MRLTRDRDNDDEAPRGFSGGNVGTKLVTEETCVFSNEKPTDFPMPDREDPSSLLYPRVLAPIGTPALQFVKEGYTVLKRRRGSVFLP